MATSLLSKLIRNQSRFESITQKLTFSHLAASTGGAATPHHPLFPAPAAAPPQTHQFCEAQNPVSAESYVQFGVYPSFSFQHFLNPVAPFAPDFSIVSEEEELNTIYASSVKKKRVKKMRKHKHRKMKRALRRKTKK